MDRCSEQFKNRGVVIPYVLREMRGTLGERMRQAKQVVLHRISGVAAVEDKCSIVIGVDPTLLSPGAI